MRCTVCGGDRFVSTEYRAGSVEAPALECLTCGAVVLEEAVARTEEERESVKMAIALRKAAQNVPDKCDE